MSDYDDDNKDYLYQRNFERKEKDEYLLETVKLLNEGCQNAKKYATKEEQNKYGVRYYEWDITDIDYEYEECRRYCLYTEAWDVCPSEYTICNSCHKIIENRIKKSFTKSKSELIYDIILLKKQMENVLERLTKLEANNENKSSE